MQYLKQSTAVTLKIGPFIDDTDGKTAETGLTIAQADVRLSKNGANIAQKTEATSCTHDELGIYGCPIDATDTATLGRLQLWVHESGALPVWHEFIVIPANVYDSLFSTDKLQVDMTQCGGSAVPAGAIPNAAADAAGGLPISDAGGLDLDTKLANTNEITAARMGALTDWINGGRLDLLLDAIPTTAMRGTDNAALANVCTEARLAELAAANLPTDIDAILADTNELQTDWANGGRLDLILDIIAADTTTDIPAKLLAYVQLLARSDAAIATDNATELTAINADGGSGAGDFANQTEALEAIRDRGDAAWSAAAGNPTVLIDTTIASTTDQTHFTLTAGSDIDDAYKDQAIVLYDASNNDYPSVRKVSAYTGATKTITLDAAPDFTIVNGDGVKTFVTAPGTTAPTANQVADQVWEESKADHTDPTTFGGQNSFVNG